MNAQQIEALREGTKQIQGYGLVRQMAKSEANRRRRKLYYWRQQDALLEAFGFVMDPVHGLLDRDDLHKMRRRDLQARINASLPDGRKHYDNAARAAGILRNGSGARFWRARLSEAHAGSDKRGIVVWLLRYARQGRVQDPALLHELSEYARIRANRFI